MCYFEFNWTANVWQFRINDRWTDFRGQRSWSTLDEVKAALQPECYLVKTDTRTYQLMCGPVDAAGAPPEPPPL